ncbi:MAG: diguanylate cyclase, partial [Ferrovum sp.]|nr:diguanylate cyclase [Ferrovum sp.]
MHQTMGQQLVSFTTKILNELAQGRASEDLAREVCLFAEAWSTGRVASITQLDDQGRLHVFSAPSAPVSLIEEFSGLRPGPYAGSCGNVAHRNEPVIVSDIDRDARWDDLRTAASHWKLKSCWSWPVCQDGKIIGTFALTGMTKGDPDVDQRALLEACSSLAGIVLVHTLVKRQEISQRHLYRALFGAVEVLIQHKSEQEMTQALCERLSADANFSAVWLGRPAPDDRFEVLAKAGAGMMQIVEARPSLVEAGDDAPLIVRAWRQKRAFFSNDVLADASLKKWHPTFAKNSWSSLLAVPVLRSGKLWAILVWASPSINTFDHHTVDLCHRVASLLGQSLDEHDLKAKIRALQLEEAQLARTDSLTGLPNRLALEEYLPKSLARAERHHRVVAVGMIDLDDFKPVNDKYGHELGDFLLQGLAQRFQTSVRESNFIARLGGDEFVVVFDDLDDSHAAEQLEAAVARLHQAVETPFDFGEQGLVRIGMTMGVVLYPQDGEKPEELLRCADVAMYQAKLHKADRTRWWYQGTNSEEPFSERAFDPFGEDACALLAAVHPYFSVAAVNFSDSFYADLARENGPAEILQALTADELEHLKKAQAAHLTSLLNPDNTLQGITREARRLGKIHALIGVTGSWMTRAMSLYRGFLRSYLENLLPNERYRALRVADARLQLDIEVQLDLMQKVTDSYNLYLSHPLDHIHSRWLESAQAELDALAKLPGILVAQVLRPMANGIFATELDAGEKARELDAVLHLPGMRPVLDTRAPAGHGLIARAWHSGQVQHTDDYGRDDRTKTWQEAFKPLGVRSALAIPVRGAREMEFVLIVLGEWPHQ